VYGRYNLSRFRQIGTEGLCLVFVMVHSAFDSRDGWGLRWVFAYATGELSSGVHIWSFEAVEVESHGWGECAWFIRSGITSIYLIMSV